MRPLGGGSRVQCVHCGHIQSKRDSLWRVEIERGLAGDESSKGWGCGLGEEMLRQPQAEGAHMATLFSTMLGRRYS